MYCLRRVIASWPRHCGLGKVMSFFRTVFSLTTSRERLYGFLFVFLTCGLIIFSSRLDMRQETDLMEQLAELQAELTQLDTKYRKREQELQTLSQHLDELLANPSTADANKIHADLMAFRHNAVKSTAVKVEASKGSGMIRWPTVYDFLPHLLQQTPASISPPYILSKGRKGVSVALGVPTVKREDQIYVIATLQSLLDAMSQEEKDDTIIIVFIAETVENYILQIANTIRKEFKADLDSGLIEVIAPPVSYYPDLSRLNTTLGDPVDRFQWRTKQNLDFAYLMMYAQSKSVYYVQLEDDILAKSNFVSAMKSLAQQRAAQQQSWFLLDFCTLGFIGKFFRTADLPKLTQFLLMFHNSKPVDWLLEDLIRTMVCGRYTAKVSCEKSIHEVWVSSKPSLFQHVGTQSSLKGKVQNLKDPQFGKINLHIAHKNPEATVASDVKTHKRYTLARAYAGETYFWGLVPEAGDHLNFKFKVPLRIKRYLFRSGNPEHPSDKFHDTTVEVLPVNPPQKKEKMTKDGFIIVGEFNSKGVAEGSLGKEYGLIKELRLTVNSDGGNWSILSEILIEPESSS
ncbi:hypothetical protein LSTR_LSTR007748 [Laodelphax striatellus]|uniref:Alpha-1,3-mannosyl-glycoprotein 4-beta-N-acetylglucosaminyltransferase B n=1 Tax=Laodelphax striatellus TaxID=195883 RepID=A0A482WK65_LAOST|nr:hypothetical protein LSTR_LSTR007748 [Laodelphax striatellus]